MEIDSAIIAATLAGCFLGGVVKGASGSGLPLVAVPLIALVTSVPVAVAVVQLPAMALNLLQANPRGSGHQVARHWPIFVTLFFATIIGVGMLKAAPPALLFAFMGAITTAAAIFLVATPNFTLPAGLRLGVGVPVALAAGLAAGLSALAGPILVPYFVALRLPKDVFISTISICYLTVIVPTVIFFIRWDLVQPELFLFSLLAIVPSMVGMAGGSMLRARIDDRQFRTLVLATLLATALGLIVKAFSA